MGSILTSLNKTIIVSILVTILFFVYFFADGGNIDVYFWQFLFRYIHVLAGTMWIGLLWYFRWGAMFTLISGLILAHLNGYLASSLQLGILSGSSRDTAIGIGMWMAIIMFINVWFVIWPNQKKALGIVDADADTKAKSARTAMLFSRTNTLLSIPMLFAMVSAQNIWA